MVRIGKTSDPAAFSKDSMRACLELICKEREVFMARSGRRLQSLPGPIKCEGPGARAGSSIPSRQRKKLACGLEAALFFQALGEEDF